MSYETRYATMVRQNADRNASTPEAAAARVKLDDAMRRAGADVDARWPTKAERIAAFDDVLEYQRERIAYWRKELGA